MCVVTNASEGQVLIMLFFLDALMKFYLWCLLYLHVFQYTLYQRTVQLHNSASHVLRGVDLGNEAEFSFIQETSILTC